MIFEGRSGSGSSSRAKIITFLVVATCALFVFAHLLTSRHSQDRTFPLDGDLNIVQSTHTTPEEVELSSEPIAEPSLPVNGDSSYPIPPPVTPHHGMPYMSDTSDLPTDEPKLPEEYDPDEPVSWCEERYSTDFLKGFAGNHTTFCTNGVASLECFASNRGNRPYDYLCAAKGVVLQNDKFHLACDMPKEKKEEYERFPEYMWWTGVRKIIDTKFSIRNDESIRAEAQALQCGTTDKPRNEQTTAVVFMRDGGHNMWHSLMEVMMYYESMDIMAMATDEKGEPYFDEQSDAGNLQVLWSDERKDGPYSELWSLWGGRKATHIKDYEWANRCFDRVIIPLPGGQNPMWDGDWEPHPCRNSTILQAFRRRVLRHMEIEEPEQDGAPIRVTIVDRTKSRQMDGMERKLTKLREKYPKLTFQTLDLAKTTFKEQLTVLRRTNVLVGTHGAGLTGQIFMQTPGSVVELLPQGLMHKGFRNMAQLMGHRYFSTHGVKIAGDHPKDWHEDPVRVADDKFARLMDMAIGNVRNMGARNQDAA